MKQKAFLPPFLFTIYGVLTLIANNITEIDLYALQTLVFSTVACGLILLSFRLIFRNTAQASLISSGAILLVFLYGLLKSSVQASVEADPAQWLLLLSLLAWGLFFIWVFVVLKRLKSYELISKYFLTVSLILNVFPVVSFTSYFIQTASLDQKVEAFLQDSYAQEGFSALTAGAGASAARPDIYYIILDAYSRADILAEIYSYDNAPFEHQLAERGFYVATQSNSNYATTLASLSSSLNMIHVNSVAQYVAKGPWVNREWIISEALDRILRQNFIMAFLAQDGYQLVSYDSGFERVSLPQVDYYMTAPAIEESNYQTKNLFELFFFNTFVEKIYLRFGKTEKSQLTSIYDAHRVRLLFTFDTIPEFASKPGNYFVFAHLVAPHPPFVFGPHGEAIDSSVAFTLAATNFANRDAQLYIDEVHYINSLVLQMIDQILAASDTPPVIILQADHGSRVYTDESRSPELKEKLFFPILNAYYLPGVALESVMYPAMSPVNTFRVVLNEYFGMSLPLLPDQSYYWDEESDYRFAPACPPPSSCEVEELVLSCLECKP